MIVATFIPGLATAGALIFTATSLNQAQESLELTRDGMVTDRYNSAITNLGDDSEDVRIGGMYALERLMSDSSRDEQTILNVLAAFVRGHAEKKEKDPEPTAADRPATDVQVAMEVLLNAPDHDSDTFPGESSTGRIDLTNSRIPGARLDGADLGDFLLDGVVLDWARLDGATLEYTTLTRAHLRNADLRDAKLSSADMVGVDATGARIQRSDLSYADVRGAIFRRADLRGADLSNLQIISSDKPDAVTPRTDFRNADLREIDWQDVDMTWTDLRGADLTNGQYLTYEKIAGALIDTKTKLPDFLAVDSRVERQIREPVASEPPTESP